MKKNVKQYTKSNILHRILTVKAIVFTLTMILICTTFSTANIQNISSKTTLQNMEKDIIWDVSINCNNSGGQTDYTVFGEAPDAHDGPPADTYDVVKPPAPQPPYIRVWLSDNLPVPYDNLWMDYRHYPSVSKVWNLTVHWMPSGGSSPTTITMAWNIAQVNDSEYTSVTLCTNDGTPLQNILVNSSYVFSCPAYVPQFFKIICMGATNQPPVANDDSANVPEDSSNNQINVLSNDYDPDNDQMTIVSVTQPSHGAATTNGAYCFYTPTLHYHGSDFFTYTISDEHGSVDTATVSINIIAKQYYLIITIQGSGTVTKAPDQQSYTYCQVVTLTANPSNGWMFNQWGGDLSGNINPMTITMNGNKSIIANFTVANHPPLTPGKPSGPAQGKPGVTYKYTAVTTDNESDQISYQFDWGDGSTSQWIGPYSSGVVTNASHTWTKKGHFSVKVKAKDIHGAESTWSDPLPITMPLSQSYSIINIHTLLDLVIRFLKGEFIGLSFIEVLRMGDLFK
jgi:hypothetical protein